MTIGNCVGPALAVAWPTMTCMKRCLTSTFWVVIALAILLSGSKATLCEKGFGDDPISIRSSGHCLLSISSAAECMQAAIENMNRGGVYQNEGFDSSRDWQSVASNGCILPSFTQKYYFNIGTTSRIACSKSYKCICKVKSCTLCPLGYYSFGGNSATCTACEKGHFCKNQSSHTRCPPGKYNGYDLQTSESACKSCPQGKYSFETGGESESVCKVCEKGHFCPAPMSKIKCLAGTYNNLVGQISVAVCKNCSRGTYSPLPGQEKCSKCEKGRYNDFSGAVAKSTCRVCTEGYYCPGGHRRACEIGYYNNLEGQDQSGACKLCEAGKYGSNNIGNTMCRSCDAGFYNDRRGLVTAKNCTECDENQYTDPNRRKCIRCSLLRPATKSRTQCSDDYTVVVVSGLIYLSIAIFYVYKIMEDPIYTIDASTKEVNQKCSKYNMLRLKLIMISSTAMFDFASDMFYIGTTPFENEALYASAWFFLFFPICLFCFENRVNVKRQFSFLTKKIYTTVSSFALKKVDLNNTEELWKIVVACLGYISFVPLLIMAYILSFVAYVTFIIIIGSMKLALHRPTLQLFFWISGYSKEEWKSMKKEEQERETNYVFSTSILNEIFFESFPELTITILNETVYNSTRSSFDWLLFLSVLSSSWSILSAGYPLVMHICQKGSFLEGLEVPYIRDEKLIINEIFRENNTKVHHKSHEEQQEKEIKELHVKLKVLKRQLKVEQKRSAELEQKNADLNSENEKLSDEIMSLSHRYDDEYEYGSGYSTEEEKEEQGYGSNASYSDEDEEASRDY